MQQKHIFISNGRSGSSFINDKIATIFNVEYQHIGSEIYGGNTNDMLKIQNPVKFTKKFSLNILLLSTVDFTGNRIV
jgi:hypothetical protein